MKSLLRLKYVCLGLILFFGASCTEELQEFDLLVTVPCEDPDTTVDPLIVSDFECQDNVNIEGVEVVRNPTETGINTSTFVGVYTDQASPTDGITINFGTINLEENGLFKFKVLTNITGDILARLQGSANAPVEMRVTVFGGDNWQQLEFDFSEVEASGYSQLVLVFNEGIETVGDDLYYIDDLLFEAPIDPCEGVTTDLSVVNDFDCQQNYFLGDPEAAEDAVTLIDNPNPGGINTSATVGQYIDNGLEPFDNLLIDFGEPIDLSTNAQFNIKVYANAQVPVIAKLEGGTMAVEKTAQIQQTNTWVELSFNFTEAQGAENTRLVLFFNAGGTDGTENDVYLIDDLRFVPFVDDCEGVEPDLTIISDFDCQQNYAVGAPGVVNLVDNPNPDAVNMSSGVGSYVDNGTEPFDALIIDLGGPFDLSENPVLSIDVLSSRQAPLLAKLEGGSMPVEIQANIDVVNGWSTYTFDFSQAIGQGNTTLVFFFNAGQDDGTTEDIYYLDNIRFESGGCSEIVENCDGVEPMLNIINDFDCQINFPFVDPASAPVVQNPNVSCANRSSNVGAYTDNGTDPFNALIVNFGQEIDLSVNNQLKIKVLSSMAAPILAKLEGGTAIEIFQDITEVGEWVEYTFDFSSAAGDGNTTLVLFFNAGETNGTPTDLYYIDDLKFEPM
ncbi:hypothetical protein [Croceiramulus getboli]|nr:hypothetical protein P8624_09640 [Flavobacteriaceae bacterium YJPT1-3]